MTASKTSVSLASVAYIMSSHFLFLFFHLPTIFISSYTCSKCRAFFGFPTYPGTFLTAWLASCLPSFPFLVAPLLGRYYVYHVYYVRAPRCGELS
ncbi:hypothetical protein F4814DRAFT_201255 [Daldinia grandis]|nr:hypothetical protein F4814DRAFT_201255 [Daldinia grandis]